MPKQLTPEQQARKAAWKREYERRRYRDDPAYRERGRARSKEYAERNKTKIREREKERNRLNRDKFNAKAKAYRKRYPDRLKAAKAKWKAANKERAKDSLKAWRKANRERVREKEAAWKAANLQAWHAMRLDAHHKRRALKKACEGSHTRHEWAEILQQHAFCCAYCGIRQTTELRLTRDHYTPLTKGGTNYADNIIPACRSCNSKKKNRDPIEFLRSEGFLI